MQLLRIERTLVAPVLLVEPKLVETAMMYRKGFAISVLSLALSTSSVALSGTYREWRDHDRDDHRVNHADRDHDHDRDHHPNGWNKGKKEG